MDDLALERHRFAKRRAGLGRKLFFKAGLEREVTGADSELAHSGFSCIVLMSEASALSIAARDAGSKDHSRVAEL
jgi:hypothetical protein